ncbi:antigen 5 like allergen Cul n 1-like [Anopheles aquasalis]|uniref:antigen 5 like allergen Cul n 1-like n=1 Tax=Anopheles aquasalis TaxID=42839 RepID=UPI00215B4D9C|nr:antigen 5 like allergen Cul n 1-like [Anopheles aquasalis]
MASQMLVTIVVFCGLIAGLSGQEYCNPSYCGTSINVGCNPPPLTGGPLCAAINGSVVDLNPTIQAFILSEHNRLRNQLAIGNLTGFASAQRMPTLAWDETLAAQAGHNARSCNFAHDACRNTAKYAYAGQNLAIQYFNGMDSTVESLVSDMVASWWSEYKDATQAQVDKYPRGYTDPAIGHFTQMVSDRSSTIGCAMQYWFALGWDTYYLVCDYGLTNIGNRPVYKKGVTASRCITGTNSNFPGLCSTSEVVPPLPNIV